MFFSKASLKGDGYVFKGSGDEDSYGGNEQWTGKTIALIVDALTGDHGLGFMDLIDYGSYLLGGLDLYLGIPIDAEHILDFNIH